MKVNTILLKKMNHLPQKKKYHTAKKNNLKLQLANFILLQQYKVELASKTSG